MAHLLSDLVSYMKFDDINIDNWMFKMYYKFREDGGDRMWKTQFFGKRYSFDNVLVWSVTSL